MRSFGFLIILVGGFVAYLGWQGKLPAAWSALVSGKAPMKGQSPNYRDMKNNDAKNPPQVGSNTPSIGAQWGGGFY